MEHGFFSAFPDQISDEFKSLILQGSSGSAHLIKLSAELFANDSVYASQMLLASYLQAPFDGNIAASILNITNKESLYSKEILTVLQSVVKFWNRPDNLNYYMSLVQQRNETKIKRYLKSVLEKEPENLFFIQQALFHGVASGDFDFALDFLKLNSNKILDPIYAASKAYLYFYKNDYDAAMKEIQKSAQVFGFIPFGSLAAKIADFRGEADAAVTILSVSVSEQPWRSSELLALYDLVNKNLSNKSDTIKKTAILIYSYNKAEELKATLKSLLQVELFDSKIFVLNNGSTDDTAKVLEELVPMFGNSIKRINLPVNIGAPAARNWLMNDPDVLKFDYLLYLDDDVEVQPDLLLRLGTAVDKYPEAGAWGCKVVDFYAPLTMQSVDLHLVRPQEAEAIDQEFVLTNISPNPFKVSDLHHQQMDCGAFDYLRPCSSVTGCCHLFKRDTLLDNGGFSLFLSPSQYDDMEHDLRLCLKGLFPVYHGGVKILHRKKTGAASRTSVAQEGNALGNKYKMQAMHPRSEILQIMAAEREILLADIDFKVKFLRENGYL